MAKYEDNEAASPDTGAAGAAPKNKSGGGGKRRGGNGQWSPRNTLLVRDFLVPCLDNRFYGDDLQWLNRSRGIFLIRWTHQGSKSFNREGRNVFRDWSVMKRKWDDQDPNRLSKAKQRVRAAFRKLPNVRRMNEGAAPHRIYRIKDIESYLKQDTKDQSKEKKKRKKRRSCGCAAGCPNCDPQEKRVQSPASVAYDEDEGMDRLYQDDEESYAGSNGIQDSRSAPPPAPSLSNIWSTMRSLTEASSEPATPPRASPEAEEPDGAATSSMSFSLADMEAVNTLISLRNAGRWSQPPQSSATNPLAPTAQGTVPHSETRQEDQVVPMEAAISSPEQSSGEDEGSLAPHSVHVYKEQVAAAMATAPRLAQPGTGDSPPMFWADAAPAQQGEQLVSAATGGSGVVSGFCPNQATKKES
uniref:Interferon regulatory factor 4 n=1 Tax=Rhipicephalus zambeziensis TaxID=60191 RepID=A0A224YTR5_9ACAR